MATPDDGTQQRRTPPRMTGSVERDQERVGTHSPVARDEEIAHTVNLQRKGQFLWGQMNVVRQTKVRL